MRARPILLLALAAACAPAETMLPAPDAGTPPEDTPDAGPACPAGMAPSSLGCMPMVPEGDCPPGTAAFLGTETCSPVGRTSCPEGFRQADDGWGCVAIVPEARCPVGQVASLGSTECAPVGWTSCGAGFVATRSGWGCDVIIPANACSGATRGSVGSNACLSMGSCSGAFPPAGAIIVDASLAAEDATHFRTIQAALDAAPEGATIAIERGTYAEALVARRPVTIVGRCAEQVSIEGGGGGTGLDVAGARDVSLSNVSLIAHDRGAAVSAGGALTLDVVRIEGAATAGAFATGTNSALTLRRSVVRGTQGSVSSSGVRVEAGAAIELEDVELASTVGSALAAIGGGATATARRILVRDTPERRRIGGTGVSVQGASVVISDSAIIDSSKYGLISAGEGTAAELDRVVIRGTDLHLGSAGYGVVATNGGRVDAVSINVAFTRGGGFMVERGAAARIERSTISNALADDTGIGGGVLARDDGRVELVGCAVVDNLSTNVTVTTGGHVHAEQSRLGFARDAISMGAAAGLGGRVELERCELGGSPGFEVQSMDEGSVAVLRRSIVRGSMTAVIDRGRLEVEESALLEGPDLAIFADAAGTEVLVRGSVLAGARAVYDEGGGGAILAAVGSHVVVEDSDITDNANAALFVEPTAVLELVRSNVAHTMSQTSGLNGVGADVQGTLIARETAFLENEGGGLSARVAGAELTLERSAFLRNVVAGIFTYSGTRTTVTDSVFDDQRVSPDATAYGMGYVGAGDLTITGSHFRRNHLAGLALDGHTNASSDGLDAFVSGSVFSHSRPDPEGYGHGIITGNDARLHLVNVYVYENASVGLAISQGSALVEDSLIARNGVGIHVQGAMLSEAGQSPAELGSRDVVLLTTTRFLENQTRIGAGELPLPFFSE